MAPLILLSPSPHLQLVGSGERWGQRLGQSAVQGGRWERGGSPGAQGLNRACSGTPLPAGSADLCPHICASQTLCWGR